MRKKVKKELTDDAFYLNNDFKQLQNEWYDKLKESGFEDIEHHDPEFIRSQDSPYMQGSDIAYRSASKFFSPAQYYRVLSLYMNTKEFKKLYPAKWFKFNYFIMDTYVQGVSYRALETIVQDNLDRFDTKFRLKTKSPIFRRMKLLIKEAKAWYDISELDE